ncbi:phage minor head protein [Halomonas sp. B23F22_10]|uniref:phage minor head protein n=1 Tax=Halomonas sp. B23F22_10 TaxID=3459515 RepID=UPI00373ED345
MTSDVKLLERLIRHQIHVQRFGGSQVKKALPIIRELARELRARIAEGGATDFQMARMTALEADLRFIVADRASQIQQQLDLEDFAVQEVGFTERLLGAAVSVDLAEGVTPELVRGLTTRRKMRLVSGDTIKELTIPQMWDEFAGAVAKDARRVVEKGILAGDTQQQMARGVAEVVTTRSRRQAETVVRTASNGIGDAARGMVYDANADLLEGERFIATLDSRVTLTCAGFDQTVHPLGQGPRPPLHYGCRSLRVPVVKEQYRVAIQGERASMDGPVSNQLTFGGFLRNQSAEFQDDYLGPARARLFRAGTIKIEQFTDNQGRPLSLDELAARYDLTMQ